VGLGHGGVPRRRRYEMVWGLGFGAILLGMMASGFGVFTKVLQPPTAQIITLCLVLAMLVPGYFGYLEQRRQIVCGAVIRFAELHYLMLDRVARQAGEGDGGAAARGRWLAEVERFLNRYRDFLSKPGDVKIIDDCRADLIDAIDRLVGPEFAVSSLRDARSA